MPGATEVASAHIAMLIPSLWLAREHVSSMQDPKRAAAYAALRERGHSHHHRALRIIRRLTAMHALAMLKAGTLYDAAGRRLTAAAPLHLALLNGRESPPGGGREQNDELRPHRLIPPITHQTFPFVNIALLAYQYSWGRRRFTGLAFALATYRVAQQDSRRGRTSSPDFVHSPFAKLLVDVSGSIVEWGPYRVTSWQPHLLESLACIASSYGTVTEEEVQRVVGTSTELRTLKAKIVRTFIGAGVPAEHAKWLILNKRSRGVRLNPLVAATVRPRAVHGRAGEPLVHTFILLCMRRAVWELFGAAGFEQAVGLLLPEARHVVEQAAFARDGMVPLRHATDFAKAMFHGPAEMNSDTVARFVERAVDACLTLLLPDLARVFAERQCDVQDLWARLLRGGQVELRWVAVGLKVRLSGHPFVDDPFAARLFASALEQMVRKLASPSARLERFRVDLLGTLCVEINVAEVAGK